MRKLYFRLWVGSFGIVMILGFIAIYGPMAQYMTPITVEIIGTLIGVMLGLSLAEIVKLVEKSDQEKSLLASMLEEVLYNSKHIDSGPTRILDDMWRMGISSAALSILDKRERSMFRTYYTHVGSYNEVASMLKIYLTLSEFEQVDVLRQNLKERAEAITNLGKEIADTFSPTKESEGSGFRAI